MKPIILTLVLKIILLNICSTNLLSNNIKSEKNIHLSQIENQTDSINPFFFKIPKNQIYYELLGAGIVYGSLNYERLIIEKDRINFSLRLGINRVWIGYSKYYFFPLQISINNRLSKSTFLEISAGSTIVYSFSKYSSSYNVPGENLSAGFVACLGFKFIVIKSIIISPKVIYFYNSEPSIFWPGLSLGFAF